MSAATTLHRAAAVPEIVEPIEAVRWVPCLLCAGTGRRLMAEEFEAGDYAGAIAAARAAAESDPLACGYAVLRRLGDAFLDRHLFADAAPEVMAEVPPGATVEGAGTGEGSPASSWAGLVKIGPRRVLLCTHREASGRRLLSLSPGASAAALAGFGPWFVRPLDQVNARQVDASPAGFEDARGQS